MYHNDLQQMETVIYEISLVDKKHKDPETNYEMKLTLNA